ncbi:alpha/beta hydrolase, partial [Escherichia coli]|nr:alpha/beta hydrolase [Escherichia coli]
ADNAVATIIHAHGNAGNMSAQWPLVRWLRERNFNVFMFDYRGFGKSKGTPSLAGLLGDTQSAMMVVRHRSDVKPQRVVRSWLCNCSAAVADLFVGGVC